MSLVSRRSAAFSTLAGNGVTVAITVAQAFLLVPLCLTHLGVNLYGAWIATSELLLWVQLLDAGIPNLLMQRVGAAVGRKDLADAARWSSTGLALLFVIGVALCSVALFMAPVVGAWAHVPDAQRDVFVDCFRVGAVASTLLMLSNGCVAMSRGMQRTVVLNAAQVTGAIGGLVVAAGMLVAGWGLWSLAIGLLVRATVTCAGAVFYLRGLPDIGVSWWLQPSRSVVRDIGRLAPFMSGASLGIVFATNSELLLVNTLFGPVPALVYALTRRAYDGMRNLLDAITWAVSGGFAHLVTAPDRHRARGVLHEILWLRFAAACLAGALVLVVNEAFVSLLFGPDNFGGLWLSVGFALHMMAAGQSFLANFLLRSTGHVAEGSLLLMAESCGRFMAMAAGLMLFGLAGAPFAGALLSGVMFVIVRKRLEHSLPMAETDSASRPRAAVPPIIVGVAVGVALMGIPISWTSIVMALTMTGLAGLAILWMTLPAVLERGTLLRWNGK